MKVFVALLLAIASVAARGSGPYLPSGWKPDGPAFYLPSEAKPAFRAAQEPLVEETEASGSDALREYGPPKLEVVLNANQGLPDVATEQTFVQEAVNVEANTEQAALVEEVSSVTESQAAEIVQSQEENVAPTATLPEDTAVPTAVIEEAVVSLSEQEPTAVSDVAPVTLLEQEAAAPTPAEEVVVGRAVDGINNIAEAIVSLEQEAKAAEVQANAEVTPTQATSGSLGQVPEGFLEYGPPGFLEYGPPKQAVVAAEASSVSENNEVRRRRFSPKFRSAKKH